MNVFESNAGHNFIDLMMRAIHEWLSTRKPATDVKHVRVDNEETITELLKDGYRIEGSGNRLNAYGDTLTWYVMVKRE